MRYTYKRSHDHKMADLYSDEDDRLQKGHNTHKPLVMQYVVTSTNL